MTCLLCGSQRVRIIDQFSFRDLRQLYFETCEVDINSCIDQPYTEKFVHLYKCDDCGLEFYSPSLRGNAKLYEALGKFDYYYMADKWEFGEALKDAAPCGSILEIGCGRGTFLSQALKMNPGIRVAGLETSPDAVRAARQSGLNVEAVTIEDFAGLHRGDFDCVCAFQVLEHVDRPDRFLSSAFQCVRPAGLSLISTPNGAGFTRYATNNFGDMPPHHLTHWTADVMRQVASSHGVKLERVAFEPVADYHKEWYRNTRTATTISRSVGWRLQRVEPDLGYRLLISLSHRLQKLIPSALWKYNQYPGHTLYAAFRT